MIATALTDFETACNRTPVNRRPTVYGAHYGNIPLGDLHLPANNTPLQRAVYGVMAPFACCAEVTTSVCIIDARAAPGEPRSVFMSRLAWTGEGVEMMHWRASYAISDTGETRVAEPVPGVSAPTAALAALSSIANQRLTESLDYSYSEAVRAAIVAMRVL